MVSTRSAPTASSCRTRTHRYRNSKPAHLWGYCCNACAGSNGTTHGVRCQRVRAAPALATDEADTAIQRIWPIRRSIPLRCYLNAVAPSYAGRCIDTSHVAVGVTSEKWHLSKVDGIWHMQMQNVLGAERVAAVCTGCAYAKPQSALKCHNGIADFDLGRDISSLQPTFSCGKCTKQQRRLQQSGRHR